MLESNVFGTGGLRVPPMVADGSKAGHCFHLLLVQACLRMPPVVADEAKLAIVLVQAACLRHEAKLAIVFTYFFLFLFFWFYAFCFSPTSGKLPCLKICFPQA